MWLKISRSKILSKLIKLPYHTYVVKNITFEKSYPNLSNYLIILMWLKISRSKILSKLIKLPYHTYVVKNITLENLIQTYQTTLSYLCGKKTPHTKTIPTKIDNTSHHQYRGRLL
jgi:hypothetical protein